MLRFVAVIMKSNVGKTIGVDTTLTYDPECHFQGHKRFQGRILDYGKGGPGNRQKYQNVAFSCAPTRRFFPLFEVWGSPKGGGGVLMKH